MLEHELRSPGRASSPARASRCRRRAARPARRRTTARRSGRGRRSRGPSRRTGARCTGPSPRRTPSARGGVRNSGRCGELLADRDLEVVARDGLVVGEGLGLVARPRRRVRGVDEVLAGPRAVGRRLAVVRDRRVLLLVRAHPDDVARGDGQPAEPVRGRLVRAGEARGRLVEDLVARSRSRGSGRTGGGRGRPRGWPPRSSGPRGRRSRRRSARSRRRPTWWSVSASRSSDVWTRISCR